MIEFGHATHSGLHREHNEDTYWADAGLGMFLVADGMGGHGRGELAAAIARDVLVDAVRTGRDPDTALREAGMAISRRAVSAPGNAPMGATLAMLRLTTASYRAVSIGDNPIHLWQNGKLVRVEGSGMPPAADVTEEEDAEPTPALPLRKRITQALGITPPADLRVEPAAGTLERGMQFLLSSDGLTEALDTAAINAIVSRTDLAAQERVDHLLLAALDAGGRDNITVLLVRIA